MEGRKDDSPFLEKPHYPWCRLHTVEGGKLSFRKSRGRPAAASKVRHTGLVGGSNFSQPVCGRYPAGPKHFRSSFLFSPFVYLCSV